MSNVFDERFRSEVVGILVDLNLIGAEVIRNEDGTVKPQLDWEQMWRVSQLDIAKLQRANEGMRKAVKEKEDQRKKAIDCNFELKQKLELANSKLVQIAAIHDEANRRITNQLG